MHSPWNLGWMFIQLNAIHAGHVSPDLPMKMSGTNASKASIARMIEPALCPNRVNLGYVDASTKRRVLSQTNESEVGSRSMPKRD